MPDISDLRAIGYVYYVTPNGGRVEGCDSATVNTVVPKKPKFNVTKEIHKLARERVGTVPAGKPIEPKALRDKVKHKKPVGADE